ncbi:MAG: hypothetical protein KGL11_15060 [Alphaproteobacteria bacterium]|nr:hypothetical protein [Alphaproteobacteria bacterium]
MAQNRKGTGKQLKRFQPPAPRHAAHQASAPPGHATDRSGPAPAAGPRGAQHGQFIDHAPKGPRRGQ